MSKDPYTEIGHAAVRMLKRNVSAEGIKQTLGALAELYDIIHGKSSGGQSAVKPPELRTRKKGKK